MGRGGGETEQHRELKRRAVLWAAARGFRACALEVRVPRSGFRADVAAARVGSGQCSEPGETAILECKQARSDLLRDNADEARTLERLREVSTRRRELEQLIGAHLPNLRRGETLFAECDEFDLDSIRHDGLRGVRREERQLQTRVYGGTKFDRIGRYCCADFLYLVVPPGLLEPHEAPPGWGILVASGSDDLDVVRPPVRLPVSSPARLALLESIAVAASRRCLADLGLDWETVIARRAQVLPD